MVTEHLQKLLQIIRYKTGKLVHSKTTSSRFKFKTPERLVDLRLRDTSLNDL